MMKDAKRARRSAEWEMVGLLDVRGLVVLVLAVLVGIVVSQATDVAAGIGCGLGTAMCLHRLVKRELR